MEGCVDEWVDVERLGRAKRWWLEGYLRFRKGIPSHDTLGHVFARLDAQEFSRCIHNWAMNFRTPLKGHGLAIDGKTLRGSYHQAAEPSPLHRVRARACDLRVSLGAVAVDKKSHEITAVPKRRELLELTGAVVTRDALHGQRETAGAILKRAAD